MTLKKNEYETLECQRKNNVYSETILTKVLSEDIIHGNILDCPEQDQRTWEFTIKEENYIDYKRRWCK